MNLFRTIFYTGIATVVKMISAVIVNKVVAILIGPSGIALIGNFQNFITISTQVGSAGINSGTTKYVAEFHEDTTERRNYIDISIFITFICTIVVSIGIMICSRFLSNLIFGSFDYTKVIISVGGMLIFTSFNAMILSIINGLKEIKLLILLNITASIIGLVTSVLLTIFFHLKGALFAIAFIQLFTFLLYVVILQKKNMLSLFRLKVIKDKKIYWNLCKFSMMAVTTLLAVPITQMIVRNIIISNRSIVEAGYWDGMNRISSMSLLVITSALSAYYLPKLSEIHTFKEFQNELIKGYKLIIPLTGGIFILLFFLRDIIIYVLYSKEFFLMKELFLPQFVGDFLKMCSWLLGYVLIAKGMTRAFIITEIASGLSYAVLAFFLVPLFGVKGAIYSYSIQYFGYFFVMLVLYKTLFVKYFRVASQE